ARRNLRVFVAECLPGANRTGPDLGRLMKRLSNERAQLAVVRDRDAVSALGSDGLAAGPERSHLRSGGIHGGNAATPLNMFGEEDSPRWLPREPAWGRLDVRRQISRRAAGCGNRKDVAADDPFIAHQAAK